MKNKHKITLSSINNNLDRNLKYFTYAILTLSFSILISLNTIKPAYAEGVMVYKSPTCGCCKKWVRHLERNGFDVRTKDMANVQPIKQKMGVQRQFQSCHTAKIGNYFIEGHVPASDIKKLLKEKPDIKGLAAPGMPMGSPGMEGHRKDKYNVVAIDKNNKSTVYSKH